MRRILPAVILCSMVTCLLANGCASNPTPGELTLLRTAALCPEIYGQMRSIGRARPRYLIRTRRQERTGSACGRRQNAREHKQQRVLVRIVSAWLGRRAIAGARTAAHACRKILLDVRESAL